MEQRTVERFRKRVVWVHWLHTVVFFIMLITGAIIFFDLTGLSGGQQIRLIHRITALFFVAVPVLYSLFDPRTALSFLKEVFYWNRDDIAWTKAAVGYYFGGRKPMPPQGHGVHQYYFMLFALDEQLRLPEGLTLWQLLEKIEPHLLGTNRLVGTYERSL